jgi:hypothetical protein
MEIKTFVETLYGVNGLWIVRKSVSFCCFEAFSLFVSDFFRYLYQNFGLKNGLENSLNKSRNQQRNNNKLPFLDPSSRFEAIFRFFRYLYQNFGLKKCPRKRPLQV